MRKRRLTFTAAIVATLVVAALSGYWIWAAGQVRTAIAQWTETQRAAGYYIAYDGPDMRGFPVRLAVTLDKPRLTAPEGWRWSGAAITGEAAFWQPLLLHLALPREQELAAVWRGHQRTLQLSAARADGVVRLDTRGQVITATLDMNDVTVREAAGGRVHADRLHQEISQPPNDSARLLLRGEIGNLLLPAAPPSPFPETVERFAYTAELVGAISPGDPALALAAWRDAGGLLEVTDLSLIWGPLEVHADGTAALDEAMRPQGAFSARIAGLPEMLDALVTQGLMDPGAAAALRFMVLTLAEGRDGAGRPIVRLPVTLQDGRVFLGPAPLARLAPVL
jgi:hypothetical protein